MKSIPTLFCLALLGSSVSAQTHDNFNGANIAVGGAENFLGILFVDETTVLPNGAGPNLVADGCTYSTSGTSIQWNGDTYYGMSTQTLMGSGSSFYLDYDAPTGSLSFTLQTFNGFPDTISVTVYDAAGLPLSTTSGISVPDATPVPYSYSGTPAGSVTITGGASWGPIIDDHIYDSGPSTPVYSVVGLVGGGTATLTVDNATPSGGVLIGYSLTGAGPTNTPFGPVDMSAPITSLPTLTANGTGTASMSTGVPARASGFTVYTQAADLGTGVLSNSLAELIL
jgi:hypothetical protein